MQLPEHFNKLINKNSSPQINFRLHDIPLNRLDLSARKTFDFLSANITLRPRETRQFLFKLCSYLEKLARLPAASLIFTGVMHLGVLHHVLILPYLKFFIQPSSNITFIPFFTALTAAIAARDVDIAVTFLEQAAAAQNIFGYTEVLAWGEQGLLALNNDFPPTRLAVRAYFETAAEQSNRLSLELSCWPFYLFQATKIARYSAPAAAAFIRYGIQTCINLDKTETVYWVNNGLKKFIHKLGPIAQECNTQKKHQIPRKTVEEELIKYFQGISSKALEHLDTISSGIALSTKSHTLALVCEAITGRQVKIKSNKSLAMVKGFTGSAATDGHTVYLPEVATDFNLFKLMALHQVMLLELDIWKTKNKFEGLPLAWFHLIADQKLLERLPGLISEMKSLAGIELPPAYPNLNVAAIESVMPMPWWGDILFELMDETNAIVQELIDKTIAGNNFNSKLIKSMVTSMMADGERDINTLWSRLQSIFDTVEFFSPEAEDLQENFKTFFYKEWDESMSDYKLDWCLVRQRIVDDEPNDFVASLNTQFRGIIRLIRRQFAVLKPERFQKFRAQPSGDELDLDALIETFVDMRASSFISDNIYIRREKNLRDVAVLFLVDLSESTAEEVAGRRIIDIQKEAVVLMAEALESLGDPYALYGFTSEGRFRVDLFSIKEFGTTYNDQVRYRIGNLKPKGLTRMGAVVRHAIYKLDGIDAVIKLMIILTDGRPYDLEYGNFDYAIADTKKAFQEAKIHRIHPFVITSDKKGAFYLKEISSQTQNIILRDVRLLPQMLPAVYKRLTS